MRELAVARADGQAGEAPTFATTMPTAPRPSAPEVTPAMSARVLRARWLLPIDRSPIENGWVEIAGGRIVRTGAGRPPIAPQDLGDVALLPGLVNAHTHLELSWLGDGCRPPGRWSNGSARSSRRGPRAPEARPSAPKPFAPLWTRCTTPARWSPATSPTR